MSGNGKHVAAMVRSYTDGDEAGFHSVAMQVAAREAKAGHTAIANDIKKAVLASRERQQLGSVTKLAQPRGELGELVEATYPEIKLKQLVVPTDLRNQIKQLLAEQRQRKNLLDYGFSPAHRLLLEGPPGTGKTMTAAVLATELQIPLITVRLDSILSKYMGETASKLRLVFDEVAQRRAVYLFDEFDALGADRSGNDVGEARRILNSFLVFLEEASDESLVLAATNHRGILDQALFRRFDVVLTYSLPDSRQAIAVIKGRLGSLATGTRMDKLGEYTEGLSHAELVKAAETAAKAVIMRGESQVTRDDIIVALASRKQASFGRAEQQS
ncbi:AAA family ATPase [Corynebacterium cystitidis]|uniref:ATPase family associated with various cellular activities (AAA) n=1 Tax=Corynebacterium cystitidis DSM 20524 TaxID=1121357 RepID=A0A1H9V7Z5_9CORY|nr:ATP-binding protein [Corynebacterium cystitidis]WJY83294.1 ATP-dependent zinc metalloprotease FtsH [Corynebacterium cystitidis DSM 20524]SES17698.1 ATPase family associated with various cellular activities (AAA) [Corynebacterium cystitidis DSM 20524]SNV63751.1 cell-division protein (ATP-dependent Zn metallopeptidase) [Corynebacterium cystitidis]